MIKGLIISNGTSGSPEYSVEERREVETDNSSRVVSVLNTTSYSVTAHVRGGFSCVGSIGNPVIERVVTRSVMDVRVQCK